MTRAISASELSRRLARQAQAVCRHYLSAGSKQGRYWLVGDVFGAPGRSLYVRLSGSDSGKGAAGRWTDAANGEYGDLLDLIRLNRGHASLRDAMDEAWAFLSLPRTEAPSPTRDPMAPAPRGSAESARRLFALSRPIAGTFAELYLRRRGVDPRIVDVCALRFHPWCYYRDNNDAPMRTFPALVAAVTDDSGRLTGVHRTWLDPVRIGEKAPVAAPRRAMGNLLGGSPKGAEFIAARWADARKVSQVAFKPDWARHAKAAPFKRNDQLLQTLPIGVVVFPGSGITDNLADKAKALGIPVWRFGGA